MAKTTVKTASYAEAEQVLTKAYEFDLTSAYSDGGRTVHGRVILANIINGGKAVEIYSNYYTESILIQNFNK